MLFAIEKKFMFQAAHWLNGLPEGHKCGRLHGHSYGVVIRLASTELDEYGMVTDFANLTPFGDYIATTLDHACLNEVRAFEADRADVGLLLPQPTSELLAEHLYLAAMRVLPADIASMVVSVSVSETRSTHATYTPEKTP